MNPEIRASESDSMRECDGFKNESDSMRECDEPKNESDSMSKCDEFSRKVCLRMMGGVLRTV